MPGVAPGLVGTVTGYQLRYHDIGTIETFSKPTQATLETNERDGKFDECRVFHADRKNKETQKWL